MEAGNGSASEAFGEIATAQRFRGPGKKLYLTSAAERRRFDRRNVESLQNKLDSWLAKTGLPAVALTLFKDKNGKLHVKFMGAPAFAEFAQNDIVKSEFTNVALKIMQSQNLEAQDTSTNAKFHPFVLDTFRQHSLQVLLEEHSIDDKRKLITHAVLGNNILKKKMWQEENRPFWWPENVPFRSPNYPIRGGERKPKVATLDKIIGACHDYVLMMGDSQLAPGNVAGEDEVAEIDSGEWERRRDSDVQMTDNDNNNDRNGDMVENHEDGGIGEDAQMATADHPSELAVNSNGKRQEERLDYMRRVTEHYSWNEEDCEEFLDAIQGVPRHLLPEYLELLPQSCSIPEQLTPNTIEYWYRHMVPTHVLESEREPIKVKGDGACLYRAIAKSMYGSGNMWCWVKLAALRHGIQQENAVMEKLSGLSTENRLLGYLITTDDVARRFEGVSDDTEYLRRCIREEVLMTVDRYRYSTLLHLFLVSGALKMNIDSICSQSELNRRIIHEDGAPAVFVMWVPTTVGGIINHVVPLVAPNIPASPAPLCAIGDLCVMNYDEERAFDVIRCELCLRSFHTYCAATEKDCYPSHWRCFCHCRTDGLSSIADFKLKKDLVKMLPVNEKSIMKFITAMSKDHVFSPLMWLFRLQKFSILRNYRLDFWVLDEAMEETLTEFLIRRIGRIAKFRSIKEISKQITLLSCVLVPEVVAYMIHTEDQIPLVHARRLVFSDPYLEHLV